MTWSTHTMGQYSVTRRTEILSHTVTCVDLENIMLKEMSQTQKGQTPLLYDSTYMKCVEQSAESTHREEGHRRLPGTGGVAMGSCLIGTEFPFGRMKKFWK